MGRWEDGKMCDAQDSREVARGGWGMREVKKKPFLYTIRLYVYMKVRPKSFGLCMLLGVKKYEGKGKLMKDSARKTT